MATTSMAAAAGPYSLLTSPQSTLVSTFSSSNVKFSSRSMLLGRPLRRHVSQGSRDESRCVMSANRARILAFPHQDKFLPYLLDAARSEEGRAALADKRREDPPLLDLVAKKMASTSKMTGPAQVERRSDYSRERPTTPPPDLPSLLLHSRIVYLGMPLVPAVTELIIAQLLYLQYEDPQKPIYFYVNSSGTSRADGETVGMETEGFAIYDTMMSMKNEIHTVGIGLAIGQACLLLACGTKGKRLMLPHASAMLQQPRLPSTGLMQASDVNIRAQEVLHNRDTLVTLLAEHTGHTFEEIKKAMDRPFYMTAQKAIKYGVADNILWRGQEAMAEVIKDEEWDRRAGIRQVERAAPGAALG